MGSVCVQHMHTLCSACLPYSQLPSARCLVVASSRKSQRPTAFGAVRAACVLQIMMIVAARGTHVGRVSLGDATPLDRAIGRLQMLDATPRNFERAEHIELPDVAETEHKGFLVSFFLPAMKVLLVFGSVAVCIYFLPITSWVTSVLEYIRASGWVGYLILAACYIPAALTASDIAICFTSPSHMDCHCCAELSICACQGFAISVLALSAGALYGPVDGTIVAVIGYNCGGLAGFLAGRYLVRDCVMDWIRTSRKALVALQVGHTVKTGPTLPIQCVNHGRLQNNS